MSYPPPHSQFRAFQILNEVERNLRERRPPADFKQKVKEGYSADFPGEEPPDDKVLEFLYEQALTAALYHEHARACENAMSLARWRQHRRWTKDVLKEIAALQQTLGRTETECVPPLLQDQITDVLKQLEPLSDFVSTMQLRDNTLEQFGSAQTRNSSLQTARSSLERTLQKQASKLSRNRRMQLISSAVVAIGLSARDNIETTSRGLRRRDRRLRSKEEKPRKSAKPKKS
jgi:hypothetical protein